MHSADSTPNCRPLILAEFNLQSYQVWLVKHFLDLYSAKITKRSCQDVLLFHIKKSLTVQRKIHSGVLAISVTLCKLDHTRRFWDFLGQIGSYQSC